MDLETARRNLEKQGGPYESLVDSLPHRYLEPFVVDGLKVDLIEPGRVLCSLTVPPRLLNMGNSLHGGATATLVDLVGSAVIYTVGAPSVGVSVEINVSYLDGAYVGVRILHPFFLSFLS